MIPSLSDLIELWTLDIHLPYKWMLCRKFKDFTGYIFCFKCRTRVVHIGDDSVAETNRRPIYAADPDFFIKLYEILKAHEHELYWDAPEEPVSI